MRIYKISTDLTEERDEYLKSNLTREEEKKIFRYFEDGNISYDLVEEDGTITSYFMCIKEVLDYVTSLFYKYEVKFHINDITNDFLLGKINIDDVSFNNYLKENLNIDLVLDKINELGINSLTDLDKEILLK